jgi:DNA-binding PadR family transcriptional regulator
LGISRIRSRARIIAARLEQVSSGALQLNMGTLYPALMRLEQRGLLCGKWGTTQSNRKARFYAVTSAGRRQLAREKDARDQMAGIIHTLLHGEA